MELTPFHKERDMKRFKSILKENEEEQYTLYTLELEKNMNRDEVLFFMNSLLKLIYKQLKDNNLLIYVDAISNEKINEEIIRKNIKSIRTILRDSERDKIKH